MRRVTVVPAPCLRVSSPSSASSAMALRMVMRDTPYSAARSRSGGKAAPASSRPSVMARRSNCANCAYSGLRSRGRSSPSRACPPGRARGAGAVRVPAFRKATPAGMPRSPPRAGSGGKRASPPGGSARDQFRRPRDHGGSAATARSGTAQTCPCRSFFLSSGSNRPAQHQGKLGKCHASFSYTKQISKNPLRDWFVRGYTMVPRRPGARIRQNRPGEASERRSVSAGNLGLAPPATRCKRGGLVNESTS